LGEEGMEIEKESSDSEDIDEQREVHLQA